MNVASKVVRLPSSVGQDELHAAIDAACVDPEVDGVLVQLPLPPHLNEYDVMERVNPKKDVDGFHPLNMGRMLARNVPPRFVPATALGCMQLLQRYNISVTVRFSGLMDTSDAVLYLGDCIVFLCEEKALEPLFCMHVRLGCVSSGSCMLLLVSE
jgi:methylenetetrahydrofolate dehydrogenase (NADP+) / methenyltetrahydrofolate cyclohydrolase